MNSDTDESPAKIVLDTNILVSAMVFGGKPEKIVRFVLEEKVTAVTSPILLAELREILNKKFPLREKDFRLTLQSIQDIFEVAEPKASLKILKDTDDNRVLEAAMEGDCSFIITGDKELLELKKYKKIQIVTADQFLSLGKV